MYEYSFRFLILLPINDLISMIRVAEVLYRKRGKSSAVMAWSYKYMNENSNSRVVKEKRLP